MTTIRPATQSVQATRATDEQAIRSTTRSRGETGAVSAEYAAITAAGVGLGGVLIKLLTSDFGQKLLEMLVEFFLAMIGIG